MNDHEAQRIAAAAHALRPDWPVSSLLTLIRKHLMDRPRRDVTVALGWVACETASHTPARVLAHGPWWLAAAVAGDTTGRREPFDPNAVCHACNKRNDARHPDDHEFLSVAQHAHQLAESDNPERRAYLLDMARENVVSAKEARTPAPEPERVPNPNVERLRAAKESA